MTIRCLYLSIILLVGLTFQTRAQDLHIEKLSTEYEENPVGIDDLHPRLFWTIESDKRGVQQVAYQIQVSESDSFSDNEVIWDTGKTNSDQSIQIPYEGPELESRKRYYWRVRVWDNQGRGSDWSEQAYWEMGLLSADDWEASWIEPPFETDTAKPQPAPMLRREFDLNGEVQSARAYVTSHGLYEMEINGHKVGDQVFTPGWTSYNKRLQYQTYDITDLLESGNNAVGVMLGDGWYRGYIGFNNQRNYYGSTLGLLAQIEIEYANGSTEVITTDGKWKASAGAIQKSDIYDGETYDARLEHNGWSSTGYGDDKWPGVNTADHGKDDLVAPEAPAVRKIQELQPVDIFETPEGDTVADMGQNMVGWLRMNVEGAEGTKVTLTHAEVLDKDGNFYTANLRGADQKDIFILAGEGEEVFEPHFTFHGFRYVKVEGYPGDVTKDDITGVVIHSDMEPTGHFETSSALVNQLQHNIVWGQKGNFLDVPTDCPQRDERLGWTGDIQVFSQTACYNMNSAGFLTKWLQDLKADQLHSGAVPHVVPNVTDTTWVGASGWADAAVIVPWTLYQAYGDVDILRRQYESMKGWVEYMRNRAGSNGTPYLWDGDATFGDWLSFNTTASDYPGAYTDKDLISTAYFARSADLLRRSAEVLGKPNDVEEYELLLEQIKHAFQKEYLTASGRIMSNTQTAYLLALQFDLLPDDMVDEAVEYLLDRIDKRGHLTTGFLGTPHLNPVLSQYGHTSQAYELLLRQEYPSWLYPVTRGATTIWERWDGLKPDDTFQDTGMNSFNHYAYGAIGEWLYKTVAGIEPASPGYKEIAIHPVPGGGLSYARSIKKSLYGTIKSAWEIEDGEFTLSIEIPVNTRARITLPGAAGKAVTTGGENIENVNFIREIETRSNDVDFEVGSGRYQFTYAMGMESSPSENGDAVQPGIDSTLGELIAHKRSREILEEQVPDLMQSLWLSQVMGYPLKRAIRVLPINIDITEEKMQIISEKLSSQ